MERNPIMMGWQLCCWRARFQPASRFKAEMRRLFSSGLRQQMRSSGISRPLTTKELSRSGNIIQQRDRLLGR